MSPIFNKDLKLSMFGLIGHPHADDHSQWQHDEMYRFMRLGLFFTNG